MSSLVAWYILFVNVIAFLMYGIDKWKSKKRRRRISEKALLLIAIVGGSVGAILGMRLFRHKTKKAKFYIGLPLIWLVHIVVVFWLKFW